MRLAPAGFRSHAALASTVSGSAEVGKAARRLFISTRTKMPRGWSNLGCRAAADPQGFDAGQYRKTEITGSSVCCTRLSVPPHPLGRWSTHRRTRQFRGERASAPTMIEEASSQRTRRLEGNGFELRSEGTGGSNPACSSPQTVRETRCRRRFHGESGRPDGVRTPSSRAAILARTRDNWLPSLGGEALGDERCVRRRIGDISRRRAWVFSRSERATGLNRRGRPLLLRMIVGKAAGFENDGAQLGDAVATGAVELHKRKAVPRHASLPDLARMADKLKITTEKS